MFCSRFLLEFVRELSSIFFSFFAICMFKITFLFLYFISLLQKIQSKLFKTAMAKTSSLDVKLVYHLNYMKMFTFVASYEKEDHGEEGFGKKY